MTRLNFLPRRSRNGTRFGPEIVRAFGRGEALSKAEEKKLIGLRYARRSEHGDLEWTAAGRTFHDNLTGADNRARRIKARVREDEARAFRRSLPYRDDQWDG